MKKYSLYGLGVFVLFSCVNVYALGIDWTASTMTVNFARPAGINEPDFSCFGDSASPAQETLANLGYDQQTNPRIENCFQQAGDYTVTMTLIDDAGNTASTSTFNFRVAPSDPSEENSSVEPIVACQQIADGSSPCNMQVSLKDRFLNPVTQIHTADIFSDINDFADDANEGAKFRSSLRVRDSVMAVDAELPDEGALDITDNDTPTDGKVNFILKAIAPSIAKVGLHLAKLVDRMLPFSAQVPAIDDAGVAEGNPSITISSPAVTVRFENPFEFRPEGDSFIWNSEEGAHGEISVVLDGANFPPATPVGTLLNQNAIFDFNDEDIPAEGKVFDFNADPTRTRTFETTVRPEGFEEGVVINDESALALSTTVQYSIGGLTVKYPAGGAGLENFNGPGGDPAEHQDVIGYGNSGLGFGIVGADIEGGIIGDARRMVVQAVTGNDNTFQIGRSTEDFRKIILENTARLGRGAENTYTGNLTYDFDNLDFGTADTAIVIFNPQTPGTVTLSDVVTLPEGRNTLIIKNGNLIIGENISYDAGRPEDSFGFILVNDNVETVPPTMGNIFVRPAVRQLAGTFYADGGLMTSDVGNPSIGVGTNNVEAGNTTQLLLNGTLFTRNTLGGSLILNNESYYTPWGTTDDAVLARQYDLHYVRRYMKDLDPANVDPNDNIGECAPVAGSCDENENAFIIRIDRKAALLPPPGFEKKGQ